MRFFLVMIALVLIGCTTEGTSKTKATYGHWIYRGSSTFNQVFQCVEEFEPHQNKECE